MGSQDSFNAKTHRRAGRDGRLSSWRGELIFFPNTHLQISAAAAAFCRFTGDLNYHVLKSTLFTAALFVTAAKKKASVPLNVTEERFRTGRTLFPPSLESTEDMM